jgi:hypothetical protein
MRIAVTEMDGRLHRPVSDEPAVEAHLFLGDPEPDHLREARQIRNWRTGSSANLRLGGCGLKPRLSCRLGKNCYSSLHGTLFASVGLRLRLARQRCRLLRRTEPPAVRGATRRILHCRGDAGDVSVLLDAWRGGTRPRGRPARQQRAVLRMRTRARQRRSLPLVSTDAAYPKAEIEKWWPLIKAANIRAE